MSKPVNILFVSVLMSIPMYNFMILFKGGEFFSAVQHFQSFGIFLPKTSNSGNVILAFTLSFITKTNRLK